MSVLRTHPEGSEIAARPEHMDDVDLNEAGQLVKEKAEALFALVMPLADRNLFVALKQERWAGCSVHTGPSVWRNKEEVCHVFKQLVHCVEEMHGKGVLHADLKPLNIVRTAAQWKLIDLDAACEIGQEPVGHKSSSAYCPPEAIYVDEASCTACVRSAMAVAKGEANYQLLTAHSSFDVWSLGCILYQMCTTDVRPLFQGGQDDSLPTVRKGADNLFTLAEWNIEVKNEKLAEVFDPLARNLVSQMLQADPLQRPSLARVLAHPFLSGKEVARMVGEKPKFDVFLSYRVSADGKDTPNRHVEKLYNLLTAKGLMVYWDFKCLKPGVDWEKGFCEGLVSSKTFVPLLSKDAINHPENDRANFSKLTADSNCDNVFLEHRLAIELQGLGLIEKVFPVFIGDLDASRGVYGNYFGGGCHPRLPDFSVTSIEEKLRHYMETQALGTPLHPDRTVKSVVDAITTCQGAFIEGEADAAFEMAAEKIVEMLVSGKTQSNRALSVRSLMISASTEDFVSPSGSPRAGLLQYKALVAQLKAEIVRLHAELASLKGQLAVVVGERESHVGASSSVNHPAGEVAALQEEIRVIQADLAAFKEPPVSL